MKQVVSRSGWMILLVVVAGLLAAGPAVAGEQRATDGEAALVAPSGDGPTNWGSASTFLTVPAYAFASRDDSPQTLAGYNRFSPTGQEVEAAVMLPSGAIVTAIELQGCDTNAAAAVVFILFRVNSDGSFVTLSPLGTTGTAPTPGCGLFNQVLTTPHTVSTANTYYVAVRSGTTSTTNYTAVRVLYRLQVSPAPGVATFPNDVPTTHPFFRFVEAMAASGLTGGCGAGAFCPDQPVTRGQMSVFLATALGLHFAP